MVTQTRVRQYGGRMTEERRDVARRRAELEAAARRQEAGAAQALIDAFLVEVRARGIAPEPLRATLMNGRSVKTDKTGWYLTLRRSVAVGEDGGYYILTVTGSPLAVFTGVALTPSDPPLVVGRGGRDGESGDLQDYLDRVLAG